MAMAKQMARVALFGALINGVLIAPAFAGWVKGSPIEGVGEVTKTIPTGANSTLHGGTGTAETASFKIDTTNATDMDCNSDDPYTEEDAGLFEGDTVWMIPAGAGTIGQGQYAATFTPGNDVKSGITVKCRVYEGHSLSYEDDSHDDYAQKQWDGTLTTFCVRMLSQPGNIEFKEDDAQASKQFGSKTNAPLSLDPIDWTGILFSDGAVPATPETGTNSQAFTCQTLAESDNGQVEGIRGTITFTPYITIDGKVRYRSTTAGLLPPGSFGTVVAAFSACYNPYAGAAVLFTTWAMGTKPSTNYAITGESAIENGTGNPPKIDVTGSVQNTAYPWSNQQVDLAPLSTSQAQTAGTPSFTVHGSYDIKTQLQCFDNSHTSEITAGLNKEIGDGWGDAKWGSSRPTYVKP